MRYGLNEHFWSVQGEGEHAGRTAVFLRLQGCPVGCEWCDSKLTWYAGGIQVAVEAFPGIVAQHPPSDLLVVTGGEPLIYDLDQLFRILREHFSDRSIHVETSGAYPYKGTERPDWTTLSPKYPVGFQVAPNVLAAANELKYVVDEHFLPDVAFEHLAQMKALGVDEPVVRLMPEGCPPRREMVEHTMALLREHPGWRFGPRLQYDYGSIAEGEGLNNRQVAAEEARRRAHAHRLDREMTVASASETEQ
jgi:organic radical activating enzyme